MLHFGPSLLSAAVFVGFSVLYFKMKLDRKLLVAALAFAVVSHVVMRVYRSYAGVENMSNYGVTCPNGYVMQEDGDCKPVGHQTTDATTGFKSEQK